MKTIKDIQKKEEWPKYGDEYYYVTDYGTTSICCWIDYTIDQSRKEFGNVFRTRNEAEQTIIKIKKALTLPITDSE